MSGEGMAWGLVISLLLWAAIIATVLALAG